MLPIELSGPWACHADYLRGLAASAPASAISPAAFAGQSRLNMAWDVAVISLTGVLSKSAPWWFSGTSTMAIRSELRAALSSERVKGIALYIDSPGGTVAGTKELADDIARAATIKPLWAHAQDLCASAAYWVGSQATKFFASPTSLVGSIGTYTTLFDMSGMAEKAGIKVHVVKAGAMKGAGVPGAPIPAEFLDEAQRIVNGMNEFFLAGVRSGRKLSAAKVKELADGRIHLAAKAAEIRLIDGVQSFEKTLAALALHADGGSITAGAAATTPRSKQIDEQEAISQFDQAVRQLMERAPRWRLSRQGACALVARQNPELHDAYLKAATAQADRKRRGG